MSHYRNLGGGKRDANEPQIMARFAKYGWHIEQISGNRLWDLNAYPSVVPVGVILNSSAVLVVHVDVKERTGKPTPAQVEKWSALAAKGIPVYVARTEADVDAIVAGAAEPWSPAKPSPAAAYIAMEQAAMKRERDQRAMGRRRRGT